jgi:signal peptidase I
LSTTAKVLPTQPVVAPAAPEEPVETPLEALSSICTILAAGLFVMAFIFQNFEIPSPSMTQTLLVGDHVVVDRMTIAPPTKWMPLVHYRPIRRGDVIVFMKPNPESPDLILVKRTIGIPGDRIHLRHGIVYVNGVAQSEPFATMPSGDGSYGSAYNAYRDDFPSVAPSEADLDQLGAGGEQWRQDLAANIVHGPEGDDLVVPPGKVFAMGDNRAQSLDGRYWGFVPMENVMGRPMFVYWSFKTPDDQENKTSFGDRIGFVFHVVLHIFDGTRWSRTLHVIR